MDSLDTAHVPPPDPENFWIFNLNEPKIIGVNPSLQMVVTLIESARAMVRISYDLGEGLTEVIDWLNLNRPCVAFRDPRGTPRLTFTLREVDPAHDIARFQITSNMRQISRSGL